MDQKPDLQEMWIWQIVNWSKNKFWPLPGCPTNMDFITCIIVSILFNLCLAYPYQSFSVWTPLPQLSDFCFLPCQKSFNLQKFNANFYTSCNERRSHHIPHQSQCHYSTTLSELQQNFQYYFLQSARPLSIFCLMALLYNKTVPIFDFNAELG